MEEFLSIELASTSMSDLIGYCCYHLNSNNLSDKERGKWEKLKDQLYTDKAMLYNGNYDETKAIIEKVDNVYCPILRDEFDKCSIYKPRLRQRKEQVAV